MTKSCPPSAQAAPVKAWQGALSCGDRLSPAFRESLAAREAARDAGLGVAAGGGVGKDIHGVQAIHRAVTAYLLAQPERVQASFDKLTGSRAVNEDGAVDLPGAVANAEAEGVSAVEWGGMFFHNGKYFLVDGQRVYPFDALCFHGVVSPLDIGWVRGIACALSAVMIHAREHGGMPADTIVVDQQAGVQPHVQSTCTPQAIAKAVAAELMRHGAVRRLATPGDAE